MSNDIKENITQPSTWKRGLYIILFAIFYSIAELILFAVVVFQFLLKLFTANTNDRLLKLGQSIATYIYQIIQYISFNSDYQPYPFGAWPKGEPKPNKKAANAGPEVDQSLEKIEQDIDVDGD